MSPIEKADIWLFQLINLRLVHPAADDLMVFLTKGNLSNHIFLLAILFILIRKGKNALPVILLALAAVGIADYIASGILKPLVQRVRPCFALDHCRLLVVQSRSFSFASSHAANAAAAASMLWIFFRRGPLVERLFALLMIVCAFLIACSRVYVGVHYPGDILAGMLIGIMSALLLYWIFSWLFKNIVQREIMSNKRNHDD
ncbi:MAG: phosphatase PAP2 family protein [Chlorobiaceae bacterium]|nr:phosphatase PAP2 family protein [Chlorobiaceae bacterium]NTV59937.1 phosphatase PAP2 family protein [Chlorobiaceae bacterium]